jgi:hypothetical protein
MKIGLSKRDDMPTLYAYLVNYEKDIKSKSGSFDINSASFASFCKSNNIKWKNSLEKRELDKKDKSENYFFFNTTQKKISKNDTAHHLLRHIRNSIAHALVSKKDNYYILIDKNSNLNISMTAKIRIDLFDSFITELIKTSS